MVPRDVPTHVRRLLPATCLTLIAASGLTAVAGEGPPPSLLTPDDVQTRAGTLNFKDGVPTAETAAKIFDTLNFTNALNACGRSIGPRAGARSLHSQPADVTRPRRKI